MKISHETNLLLLDKSLEWNDYQYVLPHLIDKYSEYKNFMLNYRKQDNSFIIMDNGLFEGVEHTEDDLKSKIELIKPNIFIVPDAWNDLVITYKNANHWKKDFLITYPTNLMVVLQGETYSEMINLFQACYKIGYRYFAINFSSKSYSLHYPSKNLSISQMMGRIKFIHEFNELITKYTYDNLYIHLLGCSLPQEFVYYKDYPIINSIDTSNPIIVGAFCNIYKDYGLLYKPKEKIENFMEKDLGNQYSDIKFNIYKFKSFVNSQIINENIIGQ